MVFEGTLKWRQHPLFHPGKIAVLAPALTLVGGYMYVHGGYGTRGYPFYRYSLTTKEWHVLGGVAYRYSHSTVLVDDKMYIIGGGRPRNYNLPIEAYDLVNTVHEHKGCRASKQVATYVESRKEIIILGTVASANGVQAFGFHLDSACIVPYRITGGAAPRDSFKAQVAASGQKLFLLSRDFQVGNVLSMLTLGHGHSAEWSQVVLQGAAVPQTNFHCFQLVNRHLVLFGGQTNNQVIPDTLLLVDPDTLEAVQIGPTSTHESLGYTGIWPNPPVEAGSVAAGEKLWVFGGRSNPKIIELEYAQAD